MNFYERWILPPILDLIMRQKTPLAKYRRAVVAAARGACSRLASGSPIEFSTVWQTGRARIRDRSFAQIAGNRASACRSISGAG